MSLQTAIRPEPWPPRGLTPDQIGRVTEYMHIELEGAMSLVDLAALIRLSPSHFGRQFKRTMGVPPHQYVIRLRVERAKRLLRQGLSIKEVAFTCGFASQEHLTRVFKRIVKATPGQFQRACLPAA
ncbi:MAG: AraC family transcriptional regulator [Caulobacteraceae bacterium]|nr:AraC family transcriptional regulator [Caulobacteraceae bacterium]